jgi:hypothetical protein
MANTKGMSEPKAASKSKPEKVREKVSSKKKALKPKEENILQPSFKKHCSYCGKPSTHAKRLIAGPPPFYPYICDECVEVCVKVMMLDDNQDWRNRLISILATPVEKYKTLLIQEETKPRSKKKGEKANV